MPSMELIPVIRKHIFWVFLILLVVSSFARNNYKSVETIVPEALQEPLQTPIASPQLIRFTSAGYSFELSPLYEFEISGMLVHKFDYRVFSIHKYDKIFSFDLCMIWGENLSRKIYRRPEISFTQDCRFCWARWDEPVGFDMTKLSNNHLLIINKRLERVVRSLVYGDQIQIKGKLVNVTATPLTRDGENCGPVRWFSSTSRQDGGAGACEVIFAEDIHILKKANVFWRYMFFVNLFGLLGWIVFNISVMISKGGKEQFPEVVPFDSKY